MESNIEIRRQIIPGHCHYPDPSNTPTGLQRVPGIILIASPTDRSVVFRVTVFDSTRKPTYKSLSRWHAELREYRPEIPCLCAANKIDANPTVVKKSFNLPQKLKMPMYFVSASDGTNVVKLFNDAIKNAVLYKKNPTDFFDKVMQELEALDTGNESFDTSMDSFDTFGDSTDSSNIVKMDCKIK
ncbi:rab-like protein 2A [Uloborus diversus]|uniref:rab-like protein 2A n=1 Tax=Uloborus diversus TaxID=327109 RepID=UPI0024090700|nr:rab-like protein 2A [Uloborus diversus]